MCDPVLLVILLDLYTRFEPSCLWPVPLVVPLGVVGVISFLLVSFICPSIYFYHVFHAVLVVLPSIIGIVSYLFNALFLLSSLRRCSSVFAFLRSCVISPLVFTSWTCVFREILIIMLVFSPGITEKGQHNRKPCTPYTMFKGSCRALST